MTDSKERENRISHLKKIRENASNKQEDEQAPLNNEDNYGYDNSEDSDDYEIADPNEMIDKLSEEYDKYSEQELTIDDEYIYKPSKDSEKESESDEKTEINEEFIIKTKLEHTNLPTDENDDYVYEDEGEYKQFSIEDEEEEEDYISDKFDKAFSLAVGDYSVFAVIGLLIGVILIVVAIPLSLSTERIFDNVMAGETGASAAILILFGILLIIVSVSKLTSIKFPFNNTFDKMKDIDEENTKSPKSNKKDIIEQKPLANDHKKVKKIGEFDISNIKEKIDNVNSKIDEEKPKKKIHPKNKSSTETNEEISGEEPQLTEEEKEYEKAKLDTESIDDIFADIKEIEDVSVINIDSKEKE